jgi:hypothetical protein
VIRGHYQPCPFCRLSPEDLAFLELFVKARGNVKEMERELGVSYWTIRGRLDEVVTRGGFAESPAAAPPAETAQWRQEVLEQLDRGEITVAEASRRLARSE